LDTSIDQVSHLYEHFGWTMDEVRVLLNNPLNIVAVANFGPSIVSAGIAEIAVIPIGEKTLRIVEITEAATLDKHQRQSVFGGEIDLVFGECNGLAAGVLSVAKIQGRIFAAEMGALYGFPGSGVLYQQVPIQGPEKHTLYNDLLPAYLTRSSLYKYYQRDHHEHA